MKINKNKTKAILVRKWEQDLINKEVGEKKKKRRKVKEFKFLDNLIIRDRRS